MGFPLQRQAFLFICRQAPVVPAIFPWNFYFFLAAGNIGLGTYLVLQRNFHPAAGRYLWAANTFRNSLPYWNLDTANYRFIFFLQVLCLISWNMDGEKWNAYAKNLGTQCLSPNNYGFLATDISFSYPNKNRFVADNEILWHIYFLDFIVALTFLAFKKFFPVISDSFINSKNQITSWWRMENCLK